MLARSLIRSAFQQAVRRRTDRYRYYRYTINRHRIELRAALILLQSSASQLALETTIFVPLSSQDIFSVTR